MHRVCADGAPNGGISFSNAFDRLKPSDFRANRQHCPHATIMRALNDAIPLRFKIGEIEVTMAIDNHGVRLIQLVASPSVST